MSEEITDSEIKLLRIEALKNKNLVRADICRIALEKDEGPHQLLNTPVWTKTKARLECERWLRTQQHYEEVMSTPVVPPEDEI